MSFPSRAALGLAVLILWPVPSHPAPRRDHSVVRVRASVPFAGCAEAVLDAFTRTHGVLARVETGDPALVAGVDLVVGDDDELTRTLEGGLADVRTAVDLGYVPWVLVTAADDPSAPRSLAEMDATLMGPLHVLGGPAGREARLAVGLGADRMVLSTDARTLRAARTALVPVTLAGGGRRRPVGVRSLVAVAAARPEALERRETQLLLRFLGTTEARRAFDQCVVVGGAATVPPRPAVREGRGAAGYARAVEGWWVPACSLRRNAYSDPAEVLGPPDAANLGRDRYRGLMSLGQGGYVIVDMGQDIVDRPGPDIRVYQTTTGEPVTVYAGNGPTGSFSLLALQRYCGNRTGGGVFSNHCDFDLAEGGLGSARYLKIEDGELYPCLAAGTATEGADIDGVESLNR